jgi:hypothetical protein
VNDSPAARPDPAEQGGEETELPADVAPASRRLRARWSRVRATADAGMSTAEYAIGTLAAVAFAGVLLKVVTSGPVQSALGAVIGRALK